LNEYHDTPVLLITDLAQDVANWISSRAVETRLVWCQEDLFLEDSTSNAGSRALQSHLIAREKVCRLFPAQVRFQPLRRRLLLKDVSCPPKGRAKHSAMKKSFGTPNRDRKSTSWGVGLHRSRSTRAFQRHSSLERHIAFGTCSKVIEKETLLDLANYNCNQFFCNRVSCSLIWRMGIKAIGFNKEQRQYLEAKFNIGQQSGMKVDGEAVSKEMQRARASKWSILIRLTSCQRSTQPK